MRSLVCVHVGGALEKERERSREIEIETQRETPQEWGTEREREPSEEAKIKNWDLTPTHVLLHNAPNHQIIIMNNGYYQMTPCESRQVVQPQHRSNRMNANGKLPG